MLFNCLLPVTNDASLSQERVVAYERTYVRTYAAHSPSHAVHSPVDTTLGPTLQQGPLLFHCLTTVQCAPCRYNVATSFVTYTACCLVHLHHPLLHVESSYITGTHQLCLVNQSTILASGIYSSSHAKYRYS